MGDGTSQELIACRVEFGKNVVWKTVVPGIGYSSPIIWEDSLFMLTAIPEKQEKILLCYNSKSGDLVWQKTVVKGDFGAKHSDNSFASGTPVTNGKLVYISLQGGEDVVVAAYDFNGNNVWKQSQGSFSSPYGYSCSSVLYSDKIYINGDSLEDFFVATISQKDGRVIWKISHSNPVHSYRPHFSGRWLSKGSPKFYW